jgi:predicted nucleotidyltransferase
VVSGYALDTVQEFAARLRSRFGARVQWVRLYGSYARGDATPDSDVDVLAIVRGLSWREKGEAIDLAFDVSMARDLHVSPVVMAEADFERLVSLESAFASNVLREGIAT